MRDDKIGSGSDRVRGDCRPMRVFEVGHYQLLATRWFTRQFGVVEDDEIESDERHGGHWSFGRGLMVVARLWSRRCVLVVLVAVLALVVVSCGTEVSDKASRQLRVAVVVDTDLGDGLGIDRAVRLAVDDVNAAGGVNGELVAEPITKNTKDDIEVAERAVTELLDGDRIEAVVGALTSKVTRAIAPSLTSNHVVECTPSATSPQLSGFTRTGYFFRTVPSDTGQAKLLAEQIAKAGHMTVGVLAHLDAYGVGFADAFREAAAELGISVAGDIFFSPDTVSYGADAQRLKALNAFANLVVPASRETSGVYQALVGAGIGPRDHPTFATDTSFATDLPEKVSPSDPSILDGLVGTVPLVVPTGEFIARYEKKYPGVPITPLLGQGYDCMMIIALAAQAAGSSRPTAFHKLIPDVVRDGESCAGFAECKELLDAGKDIKYEMVSGGVVWGRGEPVSATYNIWAVSGGKMSVVGQQTEEIAVAKS